MCISPITIKNKSQKFYLYSFANVSEQGSYQVPCGKCIECRKSQSSSWSFRLYVEYLTNINKNNYFITLTFNNSSITSLKFVNTKVREFFNNIYKYYRHSIKHFLITEFGSKTDRLHIHGILFNCPDGFKQKLRDFWLNGFVDIGFVNIRTCKYITKYILKDINNKKFISPGLGNNLDIIKSLINLDNVNSIIQFNTFTIAIPRYYKQKLFSKLHLKKVNEQLFNYYYDRNLKL